MKNFVFAVLLFCSASVFAESVQRDSDKDQVTLSSENSVEEQISKLEAELQDIQLSLVQNHVDFNFVVDAYGVTIRSYTNVDLFKRYSSFYTHTDLSGHPFAFKEGLQAKIIADYKQLIVKQNGLRQKLSDLRSQRDQAIAQAESRVALTAMKSELEAVKKDLEYLKAENLVLRQKIGLLEAKK